MKKCNEGNNQKRWTANSFTHTKGVNFVFPQLIMEDCEFSFIFILCLHNFWNISEKESLLKRSTATSFNSTKGVNFVPCSTSWMSAYWSSKFLILISIIKADKNQKYLKNLKFCILYTRFCHIYFWNRNIFSKTFTPLMMRQEASKRLEPKNFIANYKGNTFYIFIIFNFPAKKKKKILVQYTPTKLNSFNF